jgi:hypothetical protein
MSEASSPVVTRSDSSNSCEVIPTLEAEDPGRSLSFKLKVSCPKDVDDPEKVLDLYEKRFHEVVSGAKRLAGSERSFRAKFKFPGKKLPDHHAEFHFASTKPGKDGTTPNFFIRNTLSHNDDHQKTMMRIGASFPTMPRFQTWGHWALRNANRWLEGSGLAESDAGDPDEQTRRRKRKGGELEAPEEQGGGSSKKRRRTCAANHETVDRAWDATDPIGAVTRVALGAARAANAAAQAAWAASESVAKEIEAMNCVMSRGEVKETWYHVDSENEEDEEDTEDEEEAEDA